jgi:glycine oxidase
MLADSTLETPSALQELATASARLYPEFVRELQDESGVNVDLRDKGALIFPSAEEAHELEASGASLVASPRDLEPALAETLGQAYFLQERSVDPRALAAAALKSVRHRQIDLVSGSEVNAIEVSDHRATGVRTSRSAYAAPTVVNCAGAWAGQIPPLPLPTRPVKGQMLAVAPAKRDVLRHVIRTPDVYLVPRSDGRILIGTTLENAGFDKRTDPSTIQRLLRAAVQTVPELHEARMLEAWAGLRPGTSDGLPIIGPTSLPGYFMAAGHYREGILLAPVTAELMAQLVLGEKVAYDISAFKPDRFAA